ncbi:MAG: helix-turn-helix domain-containing protein [bacterium]|jgi:hypothetical protein
MTKRISGLEVLRATSHASGVGMSDLLGGRRLRRFARPRQIAMYMMRELCPHLSYPGIARICGRTDHTTAIHGVRNVARLIEEDYDVRLLVDAIRDHLSPEPVLRPRASYYGGPPAIPFWSTCVAYDRAMRKAMGRQAA